MAAYFTQWAQAFGPLGIFLIALGAALSTGIGISFIHLLRARRRVKSAEAAALNKWREQVDAVNPLAPEFHTRRVRLHDLVNPVTKRIASKRFIDCEIFGPANVVMMGRSGITGSTFTNCDFVVINQNSSIPVFNVIVFEDITIIGGSILEVTMFIPPALVSEFAALGVQFLTLTGNPTIDSQSRPSTATGTQP